MTLPTIPGVPDYPPADPTPQDSTGGVFDVWGLGHYYNMPVGMGMTPGRAGEAGGMDPGLRVTPVAPKQKWGTTQQLMEMYKDLWATGSAGKDPKNQKALHNYEVLQVLLLQAGAYGPSATVDDVRFGQWTDQTESALVKALAGYESAIKGDKTPMEFGEFLRQNRNAGSYQGKSTADILAIAGKKTAAAPQVNLADPETLRQAAQDAAVKALGQGLTPEQLNSFVAEFQGAQASYQQSTNSTVVGPDIGSDAAAYAQHADPQGYSNHQAKGYMSQLLNMFLPSDDQRPDIQPVTSVIGAH